MTVMVNGVPLNVGEAASSSVDANPIGTILAFMGTSAPKGYLVCDGAEYSVSVYPKLAHFFLEQFGDIAYFGGDGVTTFAVPDLRNMFLRGYHGDAEEKLSGNIGVIQKATVHPNIYMNELNQFVSPGKNTLKEPLYPDERLDRGQTTRSRITVNEVIDVDIGNFMQYTSRPINVAVLFCIKCIDTGPLIYSTYEKAIFQNVDPITFTKTESNGEPGIYRIGTLGIGAEIISMRGIIKIPIWNKIQELPYINGYHNDYNLLAYLERYDATNIITLRWIRKPDIGIDAFYHVEVTYKPA